MPVSLITNTVVLHTSKQKVAQIGRLLCCWDSATEKFVVLHYAFKAFTNITYSSASVQLCSVEPANQLQRRSESLYYVFDL